MRNVHQIFQKMESLGALSIFNLSLKFQRMAFIGVIVQKIAQEQVNTFLRQTDYQTFLLIKTDYNYLFISLTCLHVFDVDSECTSEQLFDKRGVCVPKIQELIRISRQIPYSFRTGDNDTTPIVKCSDLTGKFKLKYL